MLLAGFLANFWRNEKQEQLYNNITSIASLFARSVGTYNGQGVLYLSETTIVSLQIASQSNDADIFMVYPDGTYLTAPIPTPLPAPTEPTPSRRILWKRR